MRASEAAVGARVIEHRKMTFFPTIHARGTRSRLDAVLDLVAFTAKPRPLCTSLDALPVMIAKAVEADVCSIYLLEGEDLVMRGNVGFPSAALGEVRLMVGEGVTGQSVEYMRPISLDAAPEHESYRHFPGLGEERFPIFLAVPVAGPDGPLGALVLQRRDGPAFSQSEIELAAALTAPIAALTERARLVDALDRAPGHRKTSRRATLSGRSVVPGRVVGALHALPRPGARSSAEAPTSVPAKQRLGVALAHARRTLVLLSKGSSPELKRYLAGIACILDDARMPERALELAAEGKELSQALTYVGAEVVQLADRTRDEFRISRARETFEVCEALALLCQGVEVPRNAVLMGDQFTLSDLLVCARAQPVAVVLSEHATEPSTRNLLSLVGLPAVIEVAGLLRWAHPGELALVDADHGLVRLNPSRTELSALRQEKKGR